MLLFVALFLPLYPLSAVQNLILMRLRTPVARAALLLLWPQIGVALLYVLRLEIPAFVVIWALLSAAFYALRLLTVRDLRLWASLLSSSALALTWGLVAHGADIAQLSLFVIWLSLPAALLVLLTGPVVRRLGAAYAGLYAGIVEHQPRLAVILTAVVLCTVATPPFPGFFAMLDLLRDLSSAAALGVLGIWLIWGWSATRLLQGFVVASSSREIDAPDLGRGGMATYVVALFIFAAASLHFTGGGL
ncbi:MAG: hypothetical protein M0Z84_12085 [Gammaproteobacteria bacterium]|nr:hypothetical protein [Gammaproteobacteria bacterium]